MQNFNYQGAVFFWWNDKWDGSYIFSLQFKDKIVTFDHFPSDPFEFLHSINLIESKAEWKRFLKQGSAIFVNYERINGKIWIDDYSLLQIGKKHYFLILDKKRNNSYLSSKFWSFVANHRIDNFLCNHKLAFILPENRRC